jgi:hypothetical protein
MFNTPIGTTFIHPKPPKCSCYIIIMSTRNSFKKKVAHCVTTLMAKAECECEWERPIKLRILVAKANRRELAGPGLHTGVHTGVHTGLHKGQGCARSSLQISGIRSWNSCSEPGGGSSFAGRGRWRAGLRRGRTSVSEQRDQRAMSSKKSGV